MIWFNLRETNKDKDAWLRLLKNSPLTNVSCDVRLADINSVRAETVLFPAPTLHLRIPLFRWPFWMYVFVRNVRTTEILLETGITLLNVEPSSQNYCCYTATHSAWLDFRCRSGFSSSSDPLFSFGPRPAAWQ